MKTLFSENASDFLNGQRFRLNEVAYKLNDCENKLLEILPDPYINHTAIDIFVVDLSISENIKEHINRMVINVPEKHIKGL